jgi:hypothetical protein
VGQPHAHAPHPPAPRQTAFNKTNALVLVLVAAAGGLELARHGYLGLINLAFGVFGASCSVFDIWQVSFEISKRRFLWLCWSRRGRIRHAGRRHPRFRGRGRTRRRSSTAMSARCSCWRRWASTA